MNKRLRLENDGESAVKEILGRNLKVDGTAFLMCDIQEKFRPHVQYFPQIVEVARRIVEAAKIFELPLIVTEQYPKGLGSTVREIDVSGSIGPFPKTDFSMFIPEVTEQLKAKSIKNVVLFGIETHVCIQQTALDALSRGFEVYVVADGCSSRAQVDRHFAIERMRQAGCVLTTYESVLLQLCGGKDFPRFKEIQSLLRKLPEDSGLL